MIAAADLSESAKRLGAEFANNKLTLKIFGKEFSADTYSDLFKDMLDIFDGKQIDIHIGSGISTILFPLPLFPIMVCYWKPEDGLESDLHIYFNSTAMEPYSVYPEFATGKFRIEQKISSNFLPFEKALSTLLLSNIGRAFNLSAADYSLSPQAFLLRFTFLRTDGHSPSTLNMDSGNALSIF